ncbi:MAG: sterol desaturase family protein [Sulfuricaulis sp.]|uniref:sterol desaturase family protein n=1 Tax=Sulfuricaulis sp. TaxID=2003553 RepID=UPI003C56C0E4
MLQTLLQYETAIRLTAFFGVLAMVASAEIALPRRRLTASKLRRWVSNLGIVFLNSALVRLLLPATAAGFAVFAAQRGWGVFNILEASAWVSIIASIVMLDFAIYLQHVMFHAVPALWRLHRMHHADLDFDVTTGARFHPIEILLSMLIKFGVIAIIGAPAAAVIIFEVLLNATSMFNHGNLRLPLALDRVLRLFIVTPDMHRVHHSIEDHETNSNFGFNLSLWDRLLGTYKDQPDAGHEGMTIGIRDFREPRVAADLPGMLILPFLGRVTGYAINRRNWSGKP